MDRRSVFNDIKLVLARNNLLDYPDSNKTFDTHTGAWDLKLGAVISQEGKPTT